MRTLVATALALLLVSPQLAAQTPRRAGVERPKVVAEWMEKLEKSEEALLAGEWKKARKIIDRVLKEMCDRIERGDGTARLLASASFLRALSEAGLGNKQAANWDFHMAQSLMPNFSKVNLAPFGDAGKVLEPWRVSPPDAEKDQADEPLKVIEEKVPGEVPKDEISPPKKKRAPRPKYPFAKRQACIDGPVALQFIIDKQGMPLNPAFLTSQDPLLGFAAMDGARGWRFEPARLGDKPITVFYNLTVTFGLSRCTNPSALARKKADSG